MARSARNPPCGAVAAVARNDISRRIGGEIEKGDESCNSHAYLRGSSCSNCKETHPQRETNILYNMKQEYDHPQACFRGFYAWLTNANRLAAADELHLARKKLRWCDRSAGQMALHSALHGVRTNRKEKSHGVMCNPRRWQENYEKKNCKFMFS